MEADSADENYEHISDKQLKFTGTQINYYFVCRRKLWLFSHNMELESDSDLVHLGRLLHEHGYRRKFKEVQVDRIKVDFVERGEERSQGGEEPRGELRMRRSPKLPSVELHEVKRSKKMQEAHVFQLLYYIYYLRKNYGVDVTRGKLHYPLLKSITPVELTEESERKVERVMDDIRMIISMPNPPEPKWLNYCRSCAYRELCWG